MTYAYDRASLQGVKGRRWFFGLLFFGTIWPVFGPDGGVSAEEPRPGDQALARVAAVPHDTTTAAKRSLPFDSTVKDETDPVKRAKQMMAECKAHYDAIRDYSCTFYKRERFDGVLSDTHVMAMKARTQPLSFYFKCSNPKKGREAIWIKGQNDGKVVAHDAGFFKVIAGTMFLDPRGDIAMEANRHPISEAGLGHMIDTLRQRWDIELKPGVTQVEFRSHMKVGDRECTMIETTHPHRDSSFVFYRVRVFIDTKLGVPIRLEGYDWPKQAGATPELVEEYTYANIRTNLGLTDRDFDPSNPSYAYGRF